MASDNVVRNIKRGQTWYNGQTIDTNDYGTSVGVEGSEAVFRDTRPQTSYGVQVPASSREVEAIFVRNVSGVALLPGYVAVWKSGFRGRRVDGYTFTDYSAGAGVVDDHLPAAGVPNGDLFWLIRKGPVLLKTDLAGGATNVINDGDKLVALTAATSQATTAGRVQPFVATSNATQQGSQAANFFGYAMSARTTANTNANILADVLFR